MDRADSRCAHERDTMNLVVIIADTVRFDYLGVNGGPVHTPNLDALARSSRFFTRTYAASFPTVPARADYLTGTYALARIGWGPRPRELVTVPQLISASGVTTVGVVDTPFYVANGYNYDKGFDYFYDLPTQDLEGQRHGDDRIPKRSVLVPEPRRTEYDYCAPRTMTVAEMCLEQLVDTRFLLWVDTWDPHEPWDPPAWYVKRYKSDYDGRVVEPVYGRYAAHGLTEEDFQTARACHWGELTMVDRWIGRLLERLESLGIAERTAVLFTSDHGFYFGERGGQLGKMIRPDGSDQMHWIRSPLYPECTHVPLMLRVPGDAPRRDDRLVSAIDIAPTLLDFFGIRPEPHMPGASVLREQDGRSFAITAMPLSEPGDEVALVDDVTRSVLEWQPITVTTDEWMMLFSRWSDPIELYDAVRDPWCTRNLADERPEVVEELHRLMISELERAGADSGAIAARREGGPVVADLRG